MRGLLERLGLAFQLGSLAAGTILACLFLGLALDQHFRSAPCALFICMLVGVCTAIIGVQRLVRGLGRGG
ncbi:MAG: AtpZ/AtpI family protein [Chloroflexota bacterium]